MEEAYTNSKIKELEEQIVQNNKIINVITELIHKIVWWVAGIILLICILTYDSEYCDVSMIFVIEIFWIILSYGIQFLIIVTYSKSNINKLAEINKIRIEKSNKNRLVEINEILIEKLNNTIKLNKEKSEAIINICQVLNRVLELKRKEELNKEKSEAIINICQVLNRVSELKRKEELMLLEQQEKEAKEACEKKVKDLIEVKKNSILYKNLLALNSTFNFYSLNSQYDMCLECYYKPEGLNSDFEKLLMLALDNQSNEALLSDILKKCSKNTNLWDDYEIHYKSIEKYCRTSPVENMSDCLYNLYEQQLYQSNKLLKPITEIEINFEVKWHASYWDNNQITKKFFYEETVEIFRKMIMQKEEKKRRKIAQEKREAEINQVQSASTILSKLLNLNKTYKFNTILSQYYFNVDCNTKQNLVKLDFYEKLIETLSDDSQETIFNNVLTSVTENIKLWSEYESNCEKIANYPTTSPFENISLSAYLYYEKQLFNNHKLQKPITEISFYFVAEYNSAGGRNSYNREKSFSYKEIISALKEIPLRKEYEQLEIEKKRKATEEKFAKEKKLRELDRLERELLKKESEIKNKERDFLAATKGHIYSASDSPLKMADKIVISESDTPLEKMKKLKQLFDNGEISYEEYSEKRKELL